MDPVPRTTTDRLLAAVLGELRALRADLTPSTDRDDGQTVVTEPRPASATPAASGAGRSRKGK